MILTRTRSGAVRSESGIGSSTVDKLRLSGSLIKMNPIAQTRSPKAMTGIE
jgi:hypothetical protein